MVVEVIYFTNSAGLPSFGSHKLDNLAEGARAINTSSHYNSPGQHTSGRQDTLMDIDVIKYKICLVRSLGSSDQGLLIS